MSSRARPTGTNAAASCKLVLGLIKRGDGSLAVRHADVNGVSLAALVNTAVAETSSKHHLRLKWTSLQLSFDTASRWHADEGIPGRAGILALGTFTGGDFQ